jgi:simple sugar transport system permease protein
MLISGGLAGLAEPSKCLVCTIVSSRSLRRRGFDGIAVALLGRPSAGVSLASLLLAGLRLGATNGLQLKAQVPRELGGAMIAMMILLVSAPGLTAGWIARAQAGIAGLRLRRRAARNP